MKRGEGPQRRTPLQPGGELPRTPFPRRLHVSRVAGRQPRPKPAHPRRPRQQGEQKARRLLVARSKGLCEGCAAEPATDWAHRKARSQGGPWCASNGLNLGRRCHSWSHSNPVAARERGWIVRSTDDPALLPVEHAWLGWVLLRVDGSVERVVQEDAA